MPYTRVAAERLPRRPSDIAGRCELAVCCAVARNTGNGIGACARNSRGLPRGLAQPLRARCLFQHTGRLTDCRGSVRGIFRSCRDTVEKVTLPAWFFKRFTAFLVRVDCAAVGDRKARTETLVLYITAYRMFPTTALRLGGVPSDITGDLRMQVYSSLRL